MVVLGRLRKSKSPTVLGSPSTDDNIPPQSRAVSPLPFGTPPIPRNFSYPISISTSPHIQNCPDTANRESATYDQVGDIFRPSSYSGPKGPAWSQGPILSKSNQQPNTQLHFDELAIRRQLDQLDFNKSVSKERVSTRKKQRRSTLLSLSASYTRSTTSVGNFLESSETREPSFIPNKASKAHFFGDSTLPHKPPRFKRTSLIQHKTASSFDASQLVRIHTTNQQRPASSSQTCDPSIKAPELAVEAFPPYAWECMGDGRVPPSRPTEYYPASKLSKMNPNNNMAAAVDLHSSIDARKRGNSTSEVEKRKGKGGKGRWLSQLKAWVSVSEPSTQAFKQHKRNTYERAGIALDDPRAGAKLHIPTTNLPSDVIKPSGPGPEPEEIAKRKAQNKKILRQSFSTSGRSSQGSRSSTSHYSSMSSLPYIT